MSPELEEPRVCEVCDGDGVVPYTQEHYEDVGFGRMCIGRETLKIECPNCNGSRYEPD